MIAFVPHANDYPLMIHVIDEKTGSSIVTVTQTGATRKQMVEEFADIIIEHDVDKVIVEGFSVGQSIRDTLKTVLESRGYDLQSDGKVMKTKTLVTGRPRVVFDIDRGVLNQCATNIPNLEVVIVEEDPDIPEEDKVQVDEYRSAYVYRPHVEFDPEGTEGYEKLGVSEEVQKVKGEFE